MLGPPQSRARGFRRSTGMSLSLGLVQGALRYPISPNWPIFLRAEKSRTPLTPERDPRRKTQRMLSDHAIVPEKMMKHSQMRPWNRFAIRHLRQTQIVTMTARMA